MNALVLAAEGASRLPLWIIVGYLGLLVLLGGASTLFFRGTSKDYFVASRSIGPFMLLMSVFGTTMTGFALVGSSAKSFELGIGVYGLMASTSGLVHSAIFFLIGIKLWAIGKRYNYVTQVQFFRDRFESPGLGTMLFPILVLLVVPYLLVGIIAACKTIQPVTIGMFPSVFPDTKGAIPPWVTGLVICTVVLFYVFFGGVRSAAWANTFQTMVFMVMGVVAFYMIVNSEKIGGASAAYEMVKQESAEHLSRARIGKAMFITYFFIPLSVGMFPHLFQHWLTARTAKTFRLTVVAHPIFIGIVWVPCILIGMWAGGLFAAGELAMPTNVPGEFVVSAPDDATTEWVKTTPTGAPVLTEDGQYIAPKGNHVSANAALGRMVAFLVNNPVLTGLLMAGILAAIMSSLDSQFVCLGTMFTNDVVAHTVGEKRFSDRQMVWLARGFVVFVVTIAYTLSMLLLTVNVFDLGVWCFSGFASLFPLVFAAVYWRRTTRLGAISCVIVTFLTWLVFFYDDIISEESVIGVSHGGEYLVAGMMPVTFIFAASVITLVVVSLLTKPPTQSTIEKFFPTR